LKFDIGTLLDDVTKVTFRFINNIFQTIATDINAKTVPPFINIFRTKEELHNLYALPYIIRVIKSRWVR